jgi:hypothetical protein
MMIADTGEQQAEDTNATAAGRTTRARLSSLAVMKLAAHAKRPAAAGQSHESSADNPRDFCRPARTHSAGAAAPTAQAHYLTLHNGKMGIEETRSRGFLNPKQACPHHTRE